MRLPMKSGWLHRQLTKTNSAMKTSRLIRLPAALAAVITIAVGCVSMGHPNLTAARDYVRDAIAKVTDAQKANNYDMGGHASRAKELMEQAIREINLAEQAASQ